MGSFEALLNRLGEQDAAPGDKVVDALKAAWTAANPPRDEAAAGAAFGTGHDAMHLMPKASTPLEKGIACGIAMMLATETPDHSETALRSRFGLPAEDRNSMMTWAVRITAKALTLHPLSMPDVMRKAIGLVCAHAELEEGEWLKCTITTVPEYRNELFGTINGLMLALSTERGA